MIPIAPIVILTITVVRLLMKQGENGTAQSAPDPYARPKGWAVLTVFVLLPVTFTCLSAVLAGVWAAVPFFLTGLALSFPWTTARWVAIPLGWPRVAATLGRLGGYGWGADPQGGTALAAAWALLRAHEPSEKDREYVEAQIEYRVESLRGAGIVALGLLAAERGDLELARGLCRSVLYLDDKICPARARRLAAEWLLADAASAGRWKRVLNVAQTHPRAGALGAFFRAAALRLLGYALPPGKASLAFHWLCAFRWWATWPLLKRAWEPTPPVEAAPWPGEHSNDGADLLRRALALYAALASVPTGGELEPFARAVAAWDEAFASESVRDWARVRAGAYPRVDSQEALDTLRDEVQTELAAWALERGVPLSKVQPRGELLEAIVYEARDELLQRIETTATGITHRIADHKPLGTGDEWRTFVKLQRQYEQVAALGGEEARRIAYNAVHAPVCNLGAWLFNQRDEKSIANGMFQWLLLEATDVGDDDDIRRYRKNVDCGP